MVRNGMSPVPDIQVQITTFSQPPIDITINWNYLLVTQKRASYNGITRASQARDEGSIPFARSVIPGDPFRGFFYRLIFPGIFQKCHFPGANCQKSGI